MSGGGVISQRLRILALGRTKRMPLGAVIQVRVVIRVVREQLSVYGIPPPDGQGM